MKTSLVFTRTADGRRFSADKRFVIIPLNGRYSALMDDKVLGTRATIAACVKLCEMELSNERRAKFAHLIKSLESVGIRCSVDSDLNLVIHGDDAAALTFVGVDATDPKGGTRIIVRKGGEV